MRLGNLVLACFAILAIWQWDAAAQPTSYRIAPSPGSQIELIVEKTGFMSGKKHLFVFPEYQGELQLDAANPGTSTILLRLDATRIQCKDDWVSEKDLRKIESEARDKMLIVQKHAEIVFRSSAIQRRTEGKYLVEGILRIRDIEKPAKVQVTMEPGDGATFRFSGEAFVDMTAWGLKPPSAALGTVGTNKVMQLRFALIARK